MTASLPIRTPDPWQGWPDDDDGLPSLDERIAISTAAVAMTQAPQPYAPIGHDAPPHSAAWTNYRAAKIAAGDVRAYWIRTGSDEHLASLQAWQRGERSWPWPSMADEQLVFLAKGQRAHSRSFGK